MKFIGITKWTGHHQTNSNDEDPNSIPEIKDPQDLNKILDRYNMNKHRKVRRMENTGTFIDSSNIDTTVDDTNSNKYEIRAKKAALIQSKQKNSDCEPIGTTFDAEKQDDWKIQDVLCMNDNEHKIIKTCIPLDENLSAIAMEKGDVCSDKIKYLMTKGENALDQSNVSNNNNVNNLSENLKNMKKNYEEKVKNKLNKLIDGDKMNEDEKNVAVALVNKNNLNSKLNKKVNNKNKNKNKYSIPLIYPESNKKIIVKVDDKQLKDNNIVNINDQYLKYNAKTPHFQLVNKTIENYFNNMKDKLIDEIELKLLSEYKLKKRDKPLKLTKDEFRFKEKFLYDNNDNILNKKFNYLTKAVISIKKDIDIVKIKLKYLMTKDKEGDKKKNKKLNEIKNINSLKKLLKEYESQQKESNDQELLNQISHLKTTINNMEKHLKKKTDDDNIDTTEMVKKMMIKMDQLSENVHRIERDQDIEIKKKEDELKVIKQNEFWRMKRKVNEDKVKDEIKRKKDKEENDKNYKMKEKEDMTKAIDDAVNQMGDIEQTAWGID